MRKPKYNQGDMIGYKNVLYVITGIKGEHYAGIIVGDLEADEQLNTIKGIDEDTNIRLVARGTG
tara:strand:- start:614 stop:805 length:192 start_codon:yes stop_codon:yes gene_type:complete